MQLHDLKPTPGSRHRSKRVGRGIGSGLGKTCGRGSKGQKARRQIKPWFEGGQTPIHRRLPIAIGFKNVNHKEYAIINLDDLEERFEAGTQVTPELLIEIGMIKKLKDGIKLLGRGSLTKNLQIHVHKTSESAAQKVKEAGGEVVLL